MFGEHGRDARDIVHAGNGTVSRNLSQPMAGSSQSHFSQLWQGMLTGRPSDLMFPATGADTVRGTTVLRVRRSRGLGLQASILCFLSIVVSV